MAPVADDCTAFGMHIIQPDSISERSINHSKLAVNYFHFVICLPPVEILCYITKN